MTEPAARTPRPAARTPGDHPVVRLPDGTWAVLGHAEALHVATTPHVYSSATRRHLHVPNGMDGEEHRRFRAVVDAHLADDRIESLTPMITEVAERAAAELVARSSVRDVLHDYGRQVAVRVQCRWLGWPEALEDELLLWIDDNFAATRSGDEPAKVEVAERFDGIVRGILADRRARRDTGQGLPDDPTTRLLEDRVEDAQAPDGRRPLTDPELVSMLRNWTSGDLGSIASSIAVVVHHVAGDAELQDRLRVLARSESRHHQELDAAVDEMLRIADPFPSSARVTLQQTELAGHLLPEGERVAITWAAANRDERVFGDPDEYRPEENRPANIIYGAGPHVCPGRLLSTLQIRGALAAVLRATTQIRLDPQRPPVREPLPLLGFETVPVLLE